VILLMTALCLVGDAAETAIGQDAARPNAADAVESGMRSFDERIAPLFIRRCMECHSGADPQGGLNLSRQALVRQGGDSGPVLEPGRPEASLLWERVAADEMPPKHPLSADEKQLLREWITAGASWGTDPIDPFRLTTGQRAGYDWWSLQPLIPVTPPVTPGDDWSRTSIDRFVVARLREQGLAPSGPASRRTLIRRLSFDLLGLPPSPEEVEAFVADPRPDAYEQLVDRLLASPQYGIRWARHWLDVVRYGESQGFERDKLREDAWPYRDWVINAFNADMPFDEFARRQIAGDLIAPDDPASIIATGFLVAGPYDEVGQSQQSAAMRAVVRQDELEDLVSLVGQSFLGLTVHCARCHDHKFDPIRQDEYYRLASALDGVRHGSRPVLSGTDRARKELLTRQSVELRQQVARLDAMARQRLMDARRDRDAKDSGDAAASIATHPLPIARWTFDGNLQDSVGGLHGEAHGGAKPVDGRLVVDGKNAFVATVPLDRNVREKTLEAWVRLGNIDQRGGGVMSIQTLDGVTFDAIVFGEQEPRRWMAGSNGFVRTRSFEGPDDADAAQRFVHVAIVYRGDGTITAYRDGQPYGRGYQSGGPVTYAAGKAQIVFGIRHAPAGGNRMLNGAIAAAQLYDRALSDSEVAASAAAAEDGMTVDQLLAVLSADERAERDRLHQRVMELTRAGDAIQPLSTYSVSPRPPGTTHVLLRGNPATPGDVVTPGGIASLRGVNAEFGLAADVDDAQRRRRLADWITDPANPLFARVAVNRLWQYHFGAGLVETSSDFGFNGGRPSHPGLIDWLADEFRRGGMSVKRLQRLIVMSTAYRQSSTYREDAAAVDADNRLLWRREPQRIEAEAVRDATLVVAGVLNDGMNGPGYRDFETFVRNTQFYDMKDTVGPEFNRRSVYRTWVRSGRSSFLDAFDCPDPSTQTPKRAVTVTPLQALSLLNHSFVLRMSERFADRLRAASGDDPARQVDQAFALAFARHPDAGERADTVAFIREYGLAEFCRVILNSNEFLYVD